MAEKYSDNLRWLIVSQNKDVLISNGDQLETQDLTFRGPHWSKSTKMKG